MKKFVAIGALIGLNLVLLAALVSGIKERDQKSRDAQTDTKTAAQSLGKKNPPITVQTQTLTSEQNQSVPVSPFEEVYSSDPKHLAQNLRRVGCPEETVKDILVAEISRRYKSQEEALRPKPQDHVPWGWSARTSEAKLIDRRQRAAAIAREKEAHLRHALGYDVSSKMPAYAMTLSDHRFEEVLQSLPPDRRPEAQLIHEHYWAQVEDLRGRTQGFWLPEDVAQLEQFKEDRRSVLDKLTSK